ncbi:MAG: hypothetical protein K2Q14_04410, partial [Gammaproteobacteria bacterium]|nr:hypothetical protein [Gammaproteobacteria bacterium]
QDVHNIKSNADKHWIALLKYLETCSHDLNLAISLPSLPNNMQQPGAMPSALFYNNAVNHEGLYPQPIYAPVMPNSNAYYSANLNNSYLNYQPSPVPTHMPAYNNSQSYNPAYPSVSAPLITENSNIYSSAVFANNNPSENYNPSQPNFFIDHRRYNNPQGPQGNPAPINPNVPGWSNNNNNF